MKKLFWCGVGVAVAAASCVYLASRHVEHTPFPLVGQALVALGGEESSASGAGGGTEAIPGLEAPVPVEPQGAAVTMEVVAVDMGQPGHIIIEEPAYSTPVGVAGTIGSVPQADMPASLVMPYCQDNVVAGSSRMPYADEGEVGEPGEEESEPMGDVWMILRRVAAEANAAAAAEQTPVVPTETKEQEMNDEEASHHPCPEDVEYHKTHMTCTYTGRSYPLPMISPAAPEMPQETIINNKSKPQYHESKKPVGEDEGQEEQELPHHKLDTMEFRPSDAGFEHFVPGPF